MSGGGRAGQAWMAAFAALAGGCVGDDLPPDDGPPAEAVIGLKHEGGAFTPLVDGDRARLWIGAQDGLMLMPALRARYIEPGERGSGNDPSNPVALWQLAVDGRQIGHLAIQLPMDVIPGEDGLCEQDGVFVRLDALAVDDIPDLLGTPVEISVDLTDVDGRNATAAVTVIPVLPSSYVFDQFAAEARP